jgi:DNA-binding transcriptional regulator YhcF (GntR family)
VVKEVHGNKFWMSTPALAVKAHASASTVRRALRQMMDDG